MTDHNSPMLDGPELKKAERRARFERAYMAALGGYCAHPYIKYPSGEIQIIHPHEEAHKDALATVRQWDAMMAELDGEEG